MEQSKVKAVVIAGWLADDGDIELVECLGAFEDTLAAYGRAYLFLDELAETSGQNYTITPLSELEGETGYGMWAKDDNGKSRYYAFILGVEHEKGAKQ